MIGDFYRNYGYPFIDRANGGTLNGMLEGCEPTHEGCRAGHDAHSGPWHVDQADGPCALRRHDQKRPGQSAELIAQGKTEKEVVAAKLTASWDAKTSGGLGAAGAGITSADRFVSEVYQELKGGAR